MYCISWANRNRYNKKNNGKIFCYKKKIVSTIQNRNKKKKKSNKRFDMYLYIMQSINSICSYFIAVTVLVLGMCLSHLFFFSLCIFLLISCTLRENQFQLQYTNCCNFVWSINDFVMKYVKAITYVIILGLSESNYSIFI